MRWLWILTLTVAAVVVTIFVLSCLDYIGGMGWSLYPKILRSRRAIKQVLRKHGYTFPVSSFGATGIDPRYLCVCINVDADAERDRLLADSGLFDEFRLALLRSGYPAESVPLVSFSVESQETVDRDFGGNWFYARK